MKKIFFLFNALLLMSFLGFTQSIDDIDYISPFNDGLASINKGDEWAFIDDKGLIVIDYRSDLTLITIDNKSYPIFKNGRSLIQEIKNGITYFGYIDKTGTTIIEPQFINATKFSYDVAIVLKLVKQNLGYNNVLKKPIVTYKIQEILINSLGETKKYLTKLAPINMSNMTEYYPKITSKIISNRLVVVPDKNGKIKIIKI